jgi:polygalacturonase
VTITGNVFSDVQVNVHLKDCRGVTIQGNTFWEGFTHNLLLEGCNGIVVGPNNLDRNPHYDRYGNAREARNSLVFTDCEDCTITGLHVANVRTDVGVVLKKCRRMNVSGCSILDCEAGGLRLEDTTASRVSDCLIRADGVKKPGPSLVIEGGRSNVVVNNVLRDGHKVGKEAARLAGNDAGD